MNPNDIPPFQQGDVVRYISGSKAGEERTVSRCIFVNNRWEVHHTNGYFGWSYQLELLSPAPSTFRVDVWPMGYCDNGFGHEGEHPLYANNSLGDVDCKNFVTSERLLEIKQLFDAANEIENLKAERDQALNDVETLLLQRRKRNETFRI